LINQVGIHLHINETEIFFVHYKNLILDKIYIMKSINYFLIVCCLMVVCFAAQSKNIIHYVNPFIGTTDNGHTFPGASYPFGMVQPGPQTGNFSWDYCAGYRYEDTKIWGFSQNRLNGTGVPDMGDLLVMPFSGKPTDDFKSDYKKDSEKASPGYYEVKLTGLAVNNSVNVELTASPHVAMHRYLFEEGNPTIYIDFQSGLIGSQKSYSSQKSYNNRVVVSDIQVIDEYTVTGHQRVRAWVERDVFYVIKFDKPIISLESIPDDNNKEYRKIFHFDRNVKQVQMKIAFSMTGIEGAKKNLITEINHWNFEKVRLAAENKWEEYLSRVQIEGSDSQKTNFYTSMYHLLIQPNNIADVDGQYRGPTDLVSKSPFGKYYSTLSLWDTYRAANPMYTILTPELVPDMVNSMLLHAEAYGYLPIWTLWGKETYCMIGNHAVPIVVEACLKKLPGIDSERAYNLIKKSLTISHNKYDSDIYDKYGYFPFDIVPEESVSRTLECSYDDYCAAQLAKNQGKDGDYKFFMKRSGYYKNLFDPVTGLMRGKDSKGVWRTPFNPYHLSHAEDIGGDYTEGNAWQYTWHVQQDINGLIKLMGGKQNASVKLDSLFNIDKREIQNGFVSDVTGLIGQYAHGNEPSHHVVYIYSMIGKNHRTAELVREIFDRFYLPKPNGLCGNDDCGQMSAWYMFSALGFYPVNPVSKEYIIGAPQIPKAKIRLQNGKIFTMIAHNLSETNKYVNSVKLNGKEVTGYVITYDDIMHGGTLEFEMKAN